MTISTSVKTIEVAAIKPIKSNRVLSAPHIRDLIESFGATAFASAVVVRPIPPEGVFRFVPIAGFHRIEASRQAGQTVLHAIVVDGGSELEVELIQLDENLLHRQLTPSQEARAMARRKAIFQSMNPTTRQGGDRRSKDQVGSLKSFAKATAAATGRSVTTVNRAVTRGDSISEEALQLLQGTPIETGQFLDRLAKVPANEQKQIVADELAKASEPPMIEPDVDGDLARLRRCWSQSCAEAQKSFIEEIASTFAKETAEMQERK